MKKSYLFLLIALCSFSVSVASAESSFSDTTTAKRNTQKIKTIFWLRQPISILPSASTGFDGTIEIFENGIMFATYKVKKKYLYTVDYSHLLSDITINWEDVAKIKRRSSNIVTFFFKNLLYIKMKDGKKYFFAMFNKKPILRAYQKYMSTKTDEQK